jgi:hypothetical protein
MVLGLLVLKIIFFYKISYLNEEVNRGEPSHSIRLPSNDIKLFPFLDEGAK